MKAIFIPAISLFNRLNYAKKFTLFGALMLFPIALLTMLLAFRINGEVRTAKMEQDGLILLGPTLELLELVQKRGSATTSVVEHGNNASEKLSAIDKKIAEILTRLTVSQKNIFTRLETEDDYEKMRKALLSPPAPIINDLNSNRIQNKKLTETVMGFISTIREKSNLMFDSNVENYYLIDILSEQQPGLTEKIGGMSDLAVGALTRATPEVSEKESIQLSQYALNQPVEQIGTDLSRLGGLAGRYQQLHKDLKGQADSLSRIFVDQIANNLAYTLPPDQFRQQANRVVTAQRDLSNALIPILNHRLGDRIQWNSHQFMFAILIACVIIILVIYLFVGAYFSVATAISSLEHVSSELACGKLIVRAHLATKDETKRVADSFNHMVENFSQILRQTSSAADNIQQTSTELRQYADAVAEGTKRQRIALSSAEDATSKVNSSIAAVTEHVQQTVALAMHASELAKLGQKTVIEVAQDIHVVATSVREAVELVNILDQQSSDIGLIVNVIQEVADQTNLLALNAAIEAARAGEQGRGFSVVADEVRKLAEHTSNATQKINAKIASVQDGVKSTTVSMLLSNHRVIQCEGLAQQAADALQKIISQTLAAQENIEQIAIATEQQRKASQGITSDIKAIAELADRNHSIVTETVSAVHDMRNKAEGLNHAVQQFQLA